MCKHNEIARNCNCYICKYLSEDMETEAENLNDRRGKIRIGREFIENGEPEFLKLFFGSFFPLAIDQTFATWNNTLTYYGLSEHFKKLEPNELAPEYVAEVTRRPKDGEFTIKFIKQ